MPRLGDGAVRELDRAVMSAEPIAMSKRKSFRTSPPHRALGVAIMQLQLEKSISTESLAGRSRIEVGRLREIHKGRREVSFPELRRLAAGLGLPLSRLLSKAEEMRQQLAETARLKKYGRAH